jgi:hypothetical protein
MTAANSTQPFPNGDQAATHTLLSKEHQAAVLVDASGHVIGSRPDFLLWFAPAANSTNRILGDVFNTGTVPIRIRGIWLQPTFTAITGAQIGWGVGRTSAVGTAGTAVTPQELDTAGSDWPAAATARANPTGGATEAARFFDYYTFNEETNAGFAMVPNVNLLPQLGDRVMEIVLNQNQGLAVRQTVANAVGLTGMMMLATFDN